MEILLKFIFPIYLLCLNLLQECSGAARDDGEWGGRVQGVTKRVAK